MVLGNAQCIYECSWSHKAVNLRRAHVWRVCTRTAQLHNSQLHTAQYAQLRTVAHSSTLIDFNLMPHSSTCSSKSTFLAYCLIITIHCMSTTDNTTPHTINHCDRTHTMSMPGVTNCKTFCITNAFYTFVWMFKNITFTLKHYQPDI